MCVSHFSLFQLVMKGGWALLMDSKWTLETIQDFVFCNEVLKEPEFLDLVQLCMVENVYDIN